MAAVTVQLELEVRVSPAVEEVTVDGSVTAPVLGEFLLFVQLCARDSDKVCASLSVAAAYQ